MTPTADPGYGDPNAPKGSPEWAKRWRLCFQNVAKNLHKTPQANLEFYEEGDKYKAWRLLTDADGKIFREFDDFCACPRPWGLGRDPVEFNRYLDAVKGKKEADLIRLPPASQGERTDLGTDTSSHGEKKSEAGGKTARLRAILRAPELVQELYKEGLLPQTLAAKLGPKSPTPEQAAKVAEARQALEQVPRSLPKREYRKQAKEAVARVLGTKSTALDDLRRAWKRASKAEREAFIAEVGEQGW